MSRWHACSGLRARLAIEVLTLNRNPFAPSPLLLLRLTLVAFITHVAVSLKAPFPTALLPVMSLWRAIVDSLPSAPLPLKMRAQPFTFRYHLTTANHSECLYLHESHFLVTEPQHPRAVVVAFSNTWSRVMVSSTRPIFPPKNTLKVLPFIACIGNGYHLN